MNAPRIAPTMATNAKELVMHSSLQPVALRIDTSRARRRSPWLVALLCGFSARMASAQEQVSKTLGGETDEWFGYRLTAIADLDGDGASDLLVGGPRSTKNGPSSGVIRAVSSSSGAILWELFGNQSESLGYSKAIAVGDTDGDRFDDFIVFSGSPPGGAVFGGGIILYSGQTRTPLYARLGAANEELGIVMEALDDIDRDGVTDVLVRSLSPYTVHVVSGATGADIYAISAPGHTLDFGFSLASGKDVDGDGVRDFIINDPYYKQNHRSYGSCWVHSGATGALLFQFVGTQESGSFAYSTSFVTDLNQDGVANILVGAPEELASCDLGTVHAFSGRDGTKLFDLVPYWCAGVKIGFGEGVADFGDLNGDGFGDFAVLQGGGGEFDSKFDHRSQIHVFSGRDRLQIYHYMDFKNDATWTSAFGFGGIAALDVDKDGIGDFATSAVNEYDASGAAVGSSSVWRCDDLYVDALPRRPISGGATDLTIGQGDAGAPALLYLTELNGTPMNLLVAIGTLDASGRYTLRANIPLGWSGFTIGLKAFTLNARNHVIDSGTEVVTVQ